MEPHPNKNTSGNDAAYYRSPDLYQLIPATKEDTDIKTFALCLLSFLLTKHEHTPAKWITFEMFSETPM